MSTLNEDLVDAATRQRVTLLRYEATTVRQLLAVYEAAVAPLQRDLQRTIALAESGSSAAAARARLLRQRLAELDNQIRVTRATLNSELQQSLTNTVLAESQVVRRDMVQLLPREFGLSYTSIPTDRVLRVLGTDWSTRLDVGLFAVRSEVSTVLGSALTRGLSVDRSVREMKQALSITEAYKGQFTSLVRTEMQRVANESAMANYEANLDVIKAVQYLATLDSRVCPLCGPLHNQVFEHDGESFVGAPKLPRHPRCRCFYAPVTKSWEELGFPPSVRENERRRLDGRPDNVRGFEPWLRRQPVSEQRRVLGADWRYQAWVKGEPMSSFSLGEQLLSREDYQRRAA